MIPIRRFTFLMRAFFLTCLLLSPGHVEDSG
jgi:hypothetical protein